MGDQLRFLSVGSGGFTKSTSFSDDFGELPRCEALPTWFAFFVLVNVRNGIVVDADEADLIDIALLETLKPDSETESLTTLAVSLISLIISPSLFALYFFGFFPAATAIAFRFNSSNLFFFGSSGSM